MKLSMIVAVAENGVIGSKNQLPWDLPDDMRRFRELTEGHPVIMGRKTFASIGHPLPRRRNIVITRDTASEIPGCSVVGSVEEAMEVARNESTDEAFIIGGGQIYLQSLPIADRVYLTRVHASFEGDVVFPPLDAQEWQEVSHERHAADDRHSVAFTFLVYDRMK